LSEWKVCGIVTAQCTNIGTTSAENRLVTYKGKLPRDVRFFATETGNEPVREWLRGLSQEQKKNIGEDIKTIQYLEEWKEPLVKHLGDGLWEVRSNFRDGIARVIFAICDEEMVILHGFIKKTQKTPDQEIDLALTRKRQYERPSKGKKPTQRQ
jgi:phage-related protein